jgi:hypothetical protein
MEVGEESEGNLSVRQTERQKLGAQLDPALRAFVDLVVVPALVREYLSEQGHANGVAEPAASVRQFQPNHTPSAEGIL